MDVKFAVLCDYANLTQEGKLNILGVFDEINPPTLPVTLPLFFLVVSYTASPAESGSQKLLRAILLDAEGHQVLSVEQSVTVPVAQRAGSRINIQQVAGLAGVTFSRAGDYAASVLVNGEEKASVPLHVNPPRST